jgi:cobalt-zinc-cadmium efflux system outer membrane protein
VLARSSGAFARRSIGIRRVAPLMVALSVRVADAAPIRLTLEEALAQMRDRNADAVVAALKVRGAHGDLRAAGAFPNPTFSVGVQNLALGRTNPRGLGPGDTVVVQGGLSEELTLWGKRPARIEQATDALAAAEASRADVDRLAAFEVRRRFIGLQLARERLRLARENLARYGETVRVTAARAHDGDIASTEYDRIALEQRGFERELSQATSARREAADALLALVGSDADDVEPVGSLAVPSAPQDADRLVADALADRPDLRAAKASRDAAEAALRLARAEAWPNPTVGIGYTHSEFQVSGDLADAVGANVSVPLPVANQNEGAIERAEAEADAAREEVRRLALAIPREVRTAVDAYERARARLARFEGEFSRQADDARRAAELSYRDGAVSALELLEAERAFIATQRDRLDALEDVHTAAYEIARVTARASVP